jgi:hypothetical protein
MCFQNISKFSISGIYTDSKMNYIETMVSLNPEFLTPEKYEQIKEIFKTDQFKLTLYYIDIFNDVSSREKPIFKKIDARYSYLDLEYFKRSNVYFQKFTYAEDTNYFYISYNNQTYMKLSSSEEVSASIPDRINTKIDDKANLLKYFIEQSTMIKLS